MKKTYIRPVTESLPNQFRDYLMESQMKSGSVYTTEGDLSSRIEGGEEGGGTVGQDGFIWGNARETSLWDDEPVEYSKGLW